MNKTKKRKIIKMSMASKKALAKDFQVSIKTVYDALAFRSHSNTGEDIRAVALKKYKAILTEEIYFSPTIQRKR